MDTSRVVVALDGMTQKEALRIAEVLKGRVWGFKVNDLIFEDISIIKKLKKYGRVFADVKLYDIPNTVANSVKRLNLHNADIITVHASGGIEMMKAAKLNCGKSKIIAVTILTSKELKYKNEVLDLVKDVVKAKVHGIVCSGHELETVKHLPISKKMIKVVPGIRPASYTLKDDQKRKMTAKEALAFGASLIVIGRPITSVKFTRKNYKENILNALADAVRE